MFMNTEIAEVDVYIYTNMYTFVLFPIPPSFSLLNYTVHPKFDLFELFYWVSTFALTMLIASLRKNKQTEKNTVNWFMSDIKILSVKCQGLNDDKKEKTFSNNTENKRVTIFVWEILILQKKLKTVTERNGVLKLYLILIPLIQKELQYFSAVMFNIIIMSVWMTIMGTY